MPEVFGELLLLERVRVAHGRPQRAVRGAHRLAQTGAARAVPVHALAGPQPVLAGEAVDPVQLVDGVRMALLGEEHGGREHGVGQGGHLPEHALHQPARLALGVVCAQPREDGAAHVAQPLGVLAEVARRPGPVGGQAVHGVEHALLEVGVGGSRRGLPAPRAPGRVQAPEGLALGGRQRDQRAVESDGGVVVEQRRVEPVVDGVIVQPDAGEAVDLRREAADRPPRIPGASRSRREARPSRCAATAARRGRRRRRTARSPRPSRRARPRAR